MIIGRFATLLAGEKDMAGNNRVVTVFHSSKFLEAMKKHGVELKWTRPEGCKNDFKCCFAPVGQAAEKAGSRKVLTLPNKLTEAIKAVDMTFGNPSAG